MTRSTPREASTKEGGETKAQHPLVRHGRTLALLAVALVLVVPMMLRRSGPDVGSDATTFQLPLLGEAGAFNLAEHQGHPVVLEAFAPWCGACERSAPAVGRAAKAAKEAGVAFLGVAIDSSANEVEAARNSWNFNVDIALDDGRFASAYDIHLLPTFIVIDGAGKIRHVKSGAANEAEINGWLDELATN